jgi:hypothetical protein
MLGILRISPPKARELNLNSGQIVRGLVSDDGNSAEFLLGNVRQDIAANLIRWKGKVIEFKVRIDSEGGSPSQAKRAAGKASQGYPAEDAKHSPLHPKSLLTLLSNPNFSKLNFLHKIRAAALVDWINTVTPSKTIFPPFLYSAKSIDAPMVKRQLKHNGFRYSLKSSDPSGDSVDSTIKYALSILLKNLEELSDPSNNKFKPSDLVGFVDYLDTNAIEYILKKDQNEVGIRFVLLFSDFPAAELYIEGENVNPKVSGSYKWSIEVKISFDEDNSIWGRIKLVSERTVTADFLLSNPNSVNLFNANTDYLYKLFRSADIQLAHCNISEGRPLDKDRKEILKERGNLELSA